MTPFFRLLLNRAHPTITPTIVAPLPTTIKNDLDNCSFSSSDLKGFFAAPKRLLEQMHYSWIADCLSALPVATQQELIMALPLSQRPKVYQQLKYTEPETWPSGALLRFYEQALYRYLNLYNKLPAALLPQSSLTPLCNLPKDHLVQLIDLLAMHDLAYEVRKIVSTQQIKRIYGSLTPQQHSFLKMCLQQKERIIPSRMHLENWSKEKGSLQHTLQKRGLHRLALALSGQPAELIWYINHTLDVGRGRYLEQHIKQTPVPHITGEMANQVQQAIDFLEKQP